MKSATPANQTPTQPAIPAALAQRAAQHARVGATGERSGRYSLVPRRDDRVEADEDRDQPVSR